MNENQVKHMVQRFLGWRLPENFNPDCGIHFDADAAKKLNPRNLRYEPNGTNLLDAVQAEAMVRHMLEGMPETAVRKHPSHVTRSSDSSLYDEVCLTCGATDISGGGWGKLGEPCPTPTEALPAAAGHE